MKYLVALKPKVAFSREITLGDSVREHEGAEQTDAAGDVLVVELSSRERLVEAERSYQVHRHHQAAQAQRHEDEGSDPTVFRSLESLTVHGHEAEYAKAEHHRVVHLLHTRLAVEVVEDKRYEGADEAERDAGVVEAAAPAQHRLRVTHERVQRCGEAEGGEHRNHEHGDDEPLPRGVDKLGGVARQKLDQAAGEDEESDQVRPDVAAFAVQKHHRADTRLVVSHQRPVRV